VTESATDLAVEGRAMMTRTPMIGRKVMIDRRWLII
jgi:hypothetical protein